MLLWIEVVPARLRDLTCGMLADVLQGIWPFLDGFKLTIFEVREDTWGRVGVWKVSRYRLGDSPTVLGNGNDTVTDE